MIERLKGEVERKFSKRPSNPTDFNGLAMAIHKDVGEGISVSSLMRIWGYVKYSNTPTEAVLDVLARYVGFKSWTDFLNSDKITDSSDFMQKGVLKGEEIAEGAVLKLSWAPGRVCRIKALGNSRFQVIESQNAKLKEGDTFSCNLFAKGEPMFCTGIMQASGNKEIPGYVAAKTRGLSAIEIIEKDK